MDQPDIVTQAGTQQTTERPIRILFLADSHLGFDLPFKPRVNRRRRGHDFFANFERALAPALRGEADLVVHGGDLFFRARLPPALVEMALEPLVRVANSGVPVFLVPGNHERSRIPNHLLCCHPNLHIFHRPSSFTTQVHGHTLGLSGFPFHRRVGEEFERLLDQTGYREVAADFRLLILHQAVEGAKVGPVNYTFRCGPDIIPGRALPLGFDAVLSGHIHRAQTLTRDLAGRSLPAPVIYPGSIERTAFAERFEDKYYVKLTLQPGDNHTHKNLDIKYIRLPARPMIILEIDGRQRSARDLKREIRQRLAGLDPQAIVRVDIGDPGSANGQLKLPPGIAVRENDRVAQLSAAALRSLAPETMNISFGRGSGKL